MESLQAEVAPFGITTTVVNPGFFRTELLTQESTAYAAASVPDYAERTAAHQLWWKAQDGQQGGGRACRPERPDDQGRGYGHQQERVAAQQGDRVDPVSRASDSSVIIGQQVGRVPAISHHAGP